MTILKKLLIAGSLAMGFSGAANAVVIDFNYSGSSVATLTTSGATTFNLDFLAAPGGGSAFINDLFMVGPGGIYFAPSGQATSATAAYSATGLGDGNAYNWKLSFPTANTTSRFTVGESYSWTIFITDPNSWTIDKLHINAFLNGQSIKLDGCVRGSESCSPPVQVPEPATLGLMGLGLLGVAVARRRRRA
jgi:PEP-CTERM motif